MGASAASGTNALVYAGGATSLVLPWQFCCCARRVQHDTGTESLARERAILETTLTGMSDGIMIVDGDLRLMAWNQHLPKLAGVPADILRIGLPMEEILRGQVASGGSPGRP